VSVTLVIKNAKRVRRGILPFVASSTLQNFSALSHTGHDFRKKNVIVYKICVLIFSIAFA